MDDRAPPYSRICFGVFELDLRAGELRKSGVLLHLAPQPFKILALLASRPAELVTREEIRSQVWGADTFVDFEHSLNFAIKKIRDALGDDPDTPRYIKTLPRRGYRFIAPVGVMAGYAPSPGPDGTASAPAGRPPGASLRGRWIVVAFFGAVVAIAAVLFALNAGGPRDRLAAALHLKSAAARPGIESIAVLPIENLTGDAGREYLADGLTDDLISNLARIGSLRVISRTSAMRYKRTKKSLAEIARELRVDGVLEGSLQRAGGGMRINVTLVQAATDRQLWAASYAGEAGEAARLEGQVALAVAHQISARLTAEVTSRAVGGGPANPRAYDAYLRGRYLWNLRGAEAITQAAGYFEQAVREDPDFALAYSGLSDSYTIRDGATFDPVLAEAYARKAVALEPNLAEAHVSLAFAQQCQFRFADAARELRRGLELNPNYVPAHQFYTIHLLATGRPLEALAENDRALQLDPFSFPVNNMRGYILVSLRQYDRAVEHLRVSGEIDPQAGGPLWQLARIYWMQQRAAEALDLERNAARLANSDVLMRGQADVEAVLAKSGFRAACLRSVQLKERAYPRGNAMNIPLQYGCLQNKPKVLEWLDRLLQERAYGVAMLLKTAPEYDFIRSDRHFQDLLRRIGLEQ